MPPLIFDVVAATQALDALWEALDAKARGILDAYTFEAIRKVF